MPLPLGYLTQDGRRFGKLLPMNDLNDDQKKALKAFKKRVKMHQLEDDSTLGRSPLTGARSKIVSIQPPSGFGRDVWDQLADKGYLKRDSGGFYELVAGKN